MEKYEEKIVNFKKIINLLKNYAFDKMWKDERILRKQRKFRLNMTK